MTQSLDTSSNSLALIQRALRSCALFRPWPDTVLDRIARICYLGRYARGAEILERPRDQLSMLLVVSGCLEVSGTNDSGAKFMLGLSGPNEVVGLVRLVTRARRIYDYLAHDDTVIVHIPAEALHRILDEEPMLWKDVALLALERQRVSIVDLQRRALGRIHQLLAEKLLQLASWYGIRNESGSTVTLPVSQNDLASMLAVSRQTMNKELRLLAERGILIAEYGSLNIIDLPALHALASRGKV